MDSAGKEVFSNDVQKQVNCVNRLICAELFFQLIKFNSHFLMERNKHVFCKAYFQIVVVIL